MSRFEAVVFQWEGVLARLRRPELLEEALGSRPATLTDAWEVPGEARALLHSLKFRGYGIGVVSQLALDVEVLAAWMSDCGLPAYADALASDTGIEAGLGRWESSRCLAVISRRSAWTAAGAGLAVTFPSRDFPDLLRVHELVEIEG